MANVKISQISGGTAIAVAADTLFEVELADGSSHYATGAQVLAYIAGDASIAELIRDTIGTALVAGSNMTITVNDAADTITLAASGGGGGGVATRMHPGYVSGRPYRGYPAGTTNAATSADVLTAHLLSVEADVTVASLLARSVTGVSGNMLMGIYSHDDTNHKPGSLLRATSAVSTSASAADLSGALTSNLMLSRGTLYWAAAITSAAPTLVCHGATDARAAYLLGGSLGIPTGWGLVGSGYANGLPATWPSGATLTAIPNAPMVHIVPA